MENKELSAEMRKLAAMLREAVEEQKKERMLKAAHILCASKALATMQRKVRGWYEPLS